MRTFILTEGQLSSMFTTLEGKAMRKIVIDYFNFLNSHLGKTRTEAFLGINDRMGGQIKSFIIKKKMLDCIHSKLDLPYWDLFCSQETKFISLKLSGKINTSFDYSKLIYKSLLKKYKTEANFIEHIFINYKTINDAYDNELERILWDLTKESSFVPKYNPNNTWANIDRKEKPIKIGEKPSDYEAAKVYTNWDMMNNSPKKWNKARNLNEITSIDIDNEAKNADLNPTEKQKSAGNYSMGHISVKGMKIAIENPKGSYRSGTDSDGRQWKTMLNNHYGYFNITKGKDGDAVDVFIGPDIENFDKVYVVDQKVNGEFDESKVMLGFNSIEDAKNAYLSNYDTNWKGFSKITGVSLKTFKKWLYRGRKQRQPFAEYIYIKKHKEE